VISSTVAIRAAGRGDAATLARIFGEAVEDRIATFATAPHPPEEFTARIEAGLLLLVAEREGAVVAWAGVLPYSDREAYAGVGLYSIFVARSARGTGVGTRLLRALVAEAERRGLHKLVGRIFTANRASIAIAHACGFREVGVHHRHGRLDGAWHDVVVVERLLGEAAA
jgi:phosphinothricin acetyltransferase